MIVYRYIAKDEEGKTLKGKVEARDERQAVGILRGRKLVVVSLQETDKVSGLDSIGSLLHRVSGDDLVQFTQQLSTMLGSGLPLTDAIDLLRAQSKPAMTEILSEVLRDVQGGMSLADALGRHEKVFSGVYIALVRAGEAAGKLDTILERLAENEEKAREFRQKTKGALIYPAIVLAAMVLVVAVMMIFVIPQLTTMYESLDAELPFVTQVLVGVSDFMVMFWWVILLAIAGMVYFLRQWKKTASGRKQLDMMMLKIPIFGPLRVEIILTEFSRTLALLIGAGISILQALEIVANSMDNVLFKAGTRKAAKGVEKGMPLAAMMAKQEIFPMIMSQMIAVGEETGELDKILEQVSRYFEQSAEHKIKNLTTAIEPLIMVILGVMVAIIVLAIITPLYKITELF